LAGGTAAPPAPASYDLTFTTPFGSNTEGASKPTAPGDLLHQRLASRIPEATLTGTITWLG
jgi:hypothetical protein